MPRIFTAPGGRRGGLALLALAASVAGIILIVVAVNAQVSAPTPQDAGTIDSSPSVTDQAQAGGSTSAPESASPSASGPESASPLTGGSGKEPLKASKPVRIRIPAIGVDSEVFPIGLAPDGTLRVPQPGPRLNTAAWFEKSSTPGQPGPAIIEGHVDSDQGPSVFFRLGSLKPGNKITVTRQDGRVATFTVTAIRNFKKATFPTRLVYGGQDLATPQLRLITCSQFDPSIGTHIGNEIVFSKMTSVTKG